MFEDLVDKLECGVFYDLPLTFDDRGIESCSGGHILCQDCQDRLRVEGARNRIFQTECPTCKIHFVPAMNQFATAYMKIKYQGVQINCKHPICDFTDLQDPLYTHQILCYYRPTKCPGFLLNGCNFHEPMAELVEHLKKKNCCAVMMETAPPNGLECVFSGKVGNNKGKDIFRDPGPKNLRPVSALNSIVYLIHPFLQIDRAINGQWSFGIWGLINKRAAEGLYASLTIKVDQGRRYSAVLPILPILSTTRYEAIRKGAVMYLQDEQIKGALYQYRQVVFEYTLRIMMTHAIYDKIYQTPADVHETYLRRVAEPLEGSKVVAPATFVARPYSPPPPLSPEVVNIDVVTISDGEETE